MGGFVGWWISRTNKLVCNYVHRTQCNVLKSRFLVLTLHQALAIGATTQPSSRKRSAPQVFDDDDSENIDPSIFNTPKKSKNFEIDPKNFDVDHAKANATHYVLTNASSTPTVVQRPIITPAKLLKRKVEASSAPTLSERAPKNRRVEPSSAPAPAGRSPIKKRVGILSRRRVSSINPPSFANAGSHHSIPFSLNTAITNLVDADKIVSSAEASTVKSTIPVKRSWLFNIHEDTEVQEGDNMINHYARTLDISSDDESRVAAKNDRGKENIPPPGYIHASSNVHASRADMMIDEPRTPLGALNTEDFHAKGCDASSFFIVPADEEAGQVNEKVTTSSSPLQQSSISDDSGDVDGWKDFLTLIAQKNGKAKEAAGNGNGAQEPLEVEVWESESAKGEHDTSAKDLSRSNSPIRVLQAVTEAPEILDGACIATSA